MYEISNFLPLNPSNKGCVKKPLHLCASKKLSFQLIVKKFMSINIYDGTVTWYKKLLYLVNNSLNYGPAKLEYGIHQPTQECLVSIDFPPSFGDFSLHQAEVVTPALFFSHAPNLLKINLSLS